MIGTDVSDFNLHWLPQFGSVKFLVAGRCFDVAPARWEVLACEWYARHGFQELKGDRYVDGNMVKYHSVDILAAEEPLNVSTLGSHLYDSWQARKAELAKNRKEPIEPPKPLPPTKPDPIPEPKPQPKPEEPKKNPSPGLVKFGVWFGILASGLGVASFFYPPLKPIVAFVVPLVKALLAALGV